MDQDQENALRSAYKMARPRIRKLLGLLLPDEGTVEFDGMTFLVYPNGNYTERMFWLHGEPYETQSLRALRGVVETAPSTIFDLGGNCGAFTVPLAKWAHPGSVVYSFEANPEMAARLSKNVALNGLSEKVQIEVCAASAEDGFATLNIHPGNLGQTSIKADFVKNGKPMRVPTRSLLRYRDRIPKDHQWVIKADIEGAEDLALMPIFDAPKHERRPDVILIETDHKQQWDTDLTAVFDSQGYRNVLEADGNTLFQKG